MSGGVAARSTSESLIEVDGFEAVCFNAPVVETYRAEDFAVHPGQGGLGPDLCVADADLVECLERIPRFCDETTTAAEMLLDQRIACGVGNVYKSEVLWACGVHPLTSVAALDLDTRAALIDTASAFLRANLEQDVAGHAPGQRRRRGRLRPPRQAVLPVRSADRGAAAR